ncbi:MAG: septal ring lytic transglycosylase RlpA family protein [Anderseniella sp.]
MNKYLFAAGVLSACAMLLLALAPANAAETGKASWYKMGTKTANGERFKPNGLTAAHRTLPFGTKVRVKNLRNGKTVVVRINDRGPFIKSRIIDVSKGAAQKIGLIRAGVTKVSIKVVN